MIADPRARDESEVTIRVGDVYAMMVEHWYQAKDLKRCRELVAEMRERAGLAAELTWRRPCSPRSTERRGARGGGEGGFEAGGRAGDVPDGGGGVPARRRRRRRRGVLHGRGGSLGRRRVVSAGRDDQRREEG